MPGPSSVVNAGWLNQNSGRSYPVSETASLFDASGSFRIPDDFLVDAVVPIHVDPDVDPTLFHIFSIGIFGDGVVVALGYDGVQIGSVTIDAATFVRNKTFFIQCGGAFFDTIAKIVIGSLDTVNESAGLFAFDVAGARLEPTVIKPDIRGVTALYAKTGESVIGPLQGDVVLESGRNFFSAFVNGTGVPTDPDRITLNAIEGAGLSSDCGCDAAVDLPCVKTIDGIEPNVLGDFSLLESDCLKLEAIANGLIVKDECAQPCCGCQELDRLVQDMNRALDQIDGLRNGAAKLEAQMQAMETAITLRR